MKVIRLNNIRFGRLAWHNYCLRTIIIIGVGIFQSHGVIAGEAIRLIGREPEALALAVSDFKKKHVSISGDLRHYTVDLKRHGKELEIVFAPDQSRLGPNEAGTGGGTAYGLEVSYFISLDRIEIVRFYLAR